MSNPSYPLSKSKCSSELTLSEPPTVVILENESETVVSSMEKVFKDCLGWNIKFVECEKDATCEQAEFYILDIKLGKGDRQREGLTAAEIIKQVNPSSFVSLFSGIPKLQLLKEQAMRIGVDYIEAKSENLIVNVCRIAIEMITYRKELLRNCKNSLIKQDSINNKDVATFQRKVDECTEKLWDIIRLEQKYDNDSIAHPLVLDTKLKPPRLYLDDENIQAYEKKCEEDKGWFDKYEGMYVAFADGQWLGETFVAGSKGELFKLLDKSDDYKNKALFYTCVIDYDILEDDLKSIPRLSSAVQMRNWKL